MAFIKAVGIHRNTPTVSPPTKLTYPNGKFNQLTYSYCAKKKVSDRVVLTSFLIYTCPKSHKGYFEFTRLWKINCCILPCFDGIATRLHPTPGNLSLVCVRSFSWQPWSHVVQGSLVGSANDHFVVWGWWPSHSWRHWQHIRRRGSNGMVDTSVWLMPMWIGSGQFRPNIGGPWQP